MKFIKQYIPLLAVFIISGCITTKYSTSELKKYKGQNAENFLKDQTFYNLINTGNDHLFIYDSALYVEDQVGAPMSNMRGLCQINGGNIFIEPYTNKNVLDMTEVESIHKNMIIDRYFGDWVGYSNELTSLQKENVGNKFYYRTMVDYIHKGYFSPQVKCIKSNTVLWSVSIIPGKTRKDNSNIDSLYIMVNVIS
jgi:hypothetical protein